jgi:Zn-dependent protease
MSSDLNISNLAIMLLPLIFAITIHEAAHAFMAYKHGDDMAYFFGRMTLNPLKHISILGTIIVPLLSFMLGGFIFGWAKPVPINEYRLGSRSAIFWVAIAGPLANLAQALIWALLFQTLFYFNDIARYFTDPLLLMAKYGIQINILLMVFNLIPILPLDGGRALAVTLPIKLQVIYLKTAPYGIYIIFIGLMLGLLPKIIFPIYSLLVNIIYFLIN